MVVELVREDDSEAGARYVVQVTSGSRSGTVGTFAVADSPAAERLARACAIRVASSLGCRITQG